MIFLCEYSERFYMPPVKKREHTGPITSTNLDTAKFAARAHWPSPGPFPPEKLDTSFMHGRARGIHARTEL